MSKKEIQQRMDGWTAKCVNNEAMPQVLVTIQKDGKLGIVIREDMDLAVAKTLLLGVANQL